MPDVSLKVPVFTARLHDRGVFACPLHFPELAALAGKRTTSLRQVERIVKNKLKLLPLIQHYQFRAVGEPELHRHRIVLQPRTHDPAWRAEVPLVFHSVRWQHGREGCVAYIPILDIAVVAAGNSLLDEMVEAHIRSALMRERLATSLGELVWLDDYEAVELVSTVVTADIPTPKEHVLQQLERKEESVLKDVASRIRPHREAYCRDALVEQLADGLAGQMGQSTILVGASGVGKTAIVNQLVRERQAFGFADYEFWATSGARIISGAAGFGMWQERCQDLCREAAKKKVIIHFGSLVELMEVGKSIVNQQSVAAFLRPYLLRGELLAIFECTRHQWSLIEQEMPAMLDCLRRVDVEEPTETESLTILKRSAQSWGHTVPQAVIGQIDRLHRRYATYSANPGRPLTFLRNLLDDAGETTLDESRVTEVFSEQTGLPLAFLDDAVPLDLEQVRQRLATRVIGQDAAVHLIVELMATIKAGLTQPGRPIASLLFIGPTGVGKTELAKAVAEFFYQDVDRLTRFDMSEYADLLSVDRLIGGTWQQEGALTAKVREQPFGVVLFDEFEKAHPRFFDLLLQVLGEGRLTDSAGRLADFTNSVIIMTSNLGAEDRRNADVGFVETESSTHARRLREHYLRSVREFLRPELFNRIDRLVPFGALPHDVVRRIARRELDNLLVRDGVRFRRLTLQWSETTPDALAQQGYDPRYGARPLKRVVERSLLAPLASAVNTYSSETPLAAQIDVDGDRLCVSLSGAGGGASANTLPQLANLAGAIAEVRRDALAMENSHVVLQLENQLYRLERLEARVLRGKKIPHGDALLLKELAQQRDLRRRIVNARETCVQLEQAVLLSCYEQETVSLFESEKQMQRSRQELNDLLITLYSRQYANSSRIMLVAYGESENSLWELLQVYAGIVAKRDIQLSLYEMRPLMGVQLKRYLKSGTIPLSRFLVGPARDYRLADGRDLLIGGLVDDREKFLEAPREGVIGVAMVLQGNNARPLLEGEGGRHSLRISGKEYHCLVDLSGETIDKYKPVENITRRGEIANHPQRRSYVLGNHLAFESAKTGKVRCDSLVDGLLGSLEQTLITEARKWMGLPT